MPPPVEISFELAVVVVMVSTPSLPVYDVPAANAVPKVTAPVLELVTEVNADSV